MNVWFVDTVYQKELFHRQESDTTIFSEYIFRLQGRHQLWRKFCNSPVSLYPANVGAFAAFLDVDSEALPVSELHSSFYSFVILGEWRHTSSI